MGKESLVHTVCACAKIPRNPGNSDYSIKFTYPCTECKLSVTMLFIEVLRTTSQHAILPRSQPLILGGGGGGASADMDGDKSML